MIGQERGDVDPGQAMTDWINSAPPAELAAELMSVFGPDAPGLARPLAVSEFRDWMFRGHPKPSGLVSRARPVHESMAEAIQLLEHAELVYPRMISNEELRWSATRLGLATLATGKYAVRQRIRERTGL